jgi:thiamine pyrophosphate-dependent acetolactate synthase large subunit-like protein
MPGVEVDDEAGLTAAVRDALDRQGPSLVSVRTDPSPYGEMLKILRG